jgi:hypothetical protein
MRKLEEVVIALYATGFIFAFGHAAANADRCNIDFRTQGTCDAFASAATGFAAGAAWPLYLSWEMFEEATDEQ